MTVPWWKSSVIYQIYPRSFCDSNGDGVGDLAGIGGKLDYLQWLGVDAIWLSPTFPSPMKDFGYDVADYCDVDPVFGDLAAMDALVDAAHSRNIKVLLDWVPNHTSDQHPWFVESRSSRDNAKADWYVWRDATRQDPPNNWTAAFVSGSAWTFDETRQQVYLHNFLPEQPDLNWDNPEVVAAMLATLRFWLDRGIDGFRMDVIHLIGKDPSLPSIPENLTPRDRLNFHDWPATHGHLREIRALLDSYPGDRVSVGEVYLMSTALVATYYGDGDELHLSFNFPALWARWDANAWRKQINRVSEGFPDHAWPTWVLSNHDVPRHRTRYGGSEARARAAALLLLTQRGTPFLYAGEELGLEDARVPTERVVDPGGRDGCRAPVPWTPESDHGWGVTDPWLPWPPEADTRNAAGERDDENSMLHLYRRLLAARRASPALQVGDFAWLDSPAGVLVYQRSAGSDTRVVAVNFSDERVSVELAGAWDVEVSTSGIRGPFVGAVAPNEAVVLVARV